MAKARRNRRATGKDQEIDAGGGSYPTGVPGMWSRAVDNTAGSIGRYVATPPRGPSMPNLGGGTKNIRGQVYTPSGVYEGRQVFIRKPILTENQIEGILKAQQTKAMRQFARDQRMGARAAKIGLGAGAVGGAGALHAGQTIVENVKKVVKKARGGGAKKK